MITSSLLQNQVVNEETRMITTVGRLETADTKGELGSIIAEELSRYSQMDLQIIGGWLHTEIIRLPRPYRERIYPYLQDQLFGAYHRVLIMSRSGGFTDMTEPIRNKDNFLHFCEIIPKACYRFDESEKRIPFRYTPFHRAFYYLISAFTIFVLEQPGHPVGTPFPGGYCVEESKGIFSCIIRDREKEVWYSICNFCPAHQKEEILN